MDLLTILPMAIVMIAGPQIISAVFLATSAAWSRNSAAFLSGAALAVTSFVTIMYVVMRLVKSGASSDKGTGSHVLDVVVLVLLVFLAVYVFLDRKRSEPPKWMGKLETATPRFSFILGFLLLGIFPTDIATSAAVAARLARQGNPWWNAIPFILLTVLLLALPVASRCPARQTGARLPPQGPRLDEHELMDRQRNRDPVLHRHHHPQPDKLNRYT
jgi:hypothetical protein